MFLLLLDIKPAHAVLFFLFRRINPSCYFTNWHFYSFRILPASAEEGDGCRDKDPQPVSSPLLQQKQIIPTDLPPLVTVGDDRRRVSNRTNVGETHLFEGDKYRFDIPLTGM